MNSSILKIKQLYSLIYLISQSQINKICLKSRLPMCFVLFIPYSNQSTKPYPPGQGSPDLKKSILCELFINNWKANYGSKCLLKPFTFSWGHINLSNACGAAERLNGQHYQKENANHKTIKSMRNSRINTHGGGPVLCKACGQYHSDACTQSEKWTAYRTIQGDYDQGIVLTESSSEVTLCLDQFFILQRA